MPNESELIKQFNALSTQRRTLWFWQVLAEERLSRQQRSVERRLEHALEAWYGGAEQTLARLEQEWAARRLSGLPCSEPGAFSALIQKRRDLIKLVREGNAITLSLAIGRRLMVNIDNLKPGLLSLHSGRQLAELTERSARLERASWALHQQLEALS